MATNNHRNGSQMRTSVNRPRAHGSNVEPGEQKPDKPTLLIVDDDLEFVELITLVLRREGMDVVTALDGHEALEKYEQVKPDMILLDLMMPGMDGWETFRRLRAVTEAPIILVSAKGGEEDVVAGLEYGVDDYITKPFNRRELTARIRAVLRRSATATQDSRAASPERQLTVEDDPSDPALISIRRDAGTELNSGHPVIPNRTLSPAHRGRGG